MTEPMAAPTSNQPKQELPFAYPSGVKPADYVTLQLSSKSYFVWNKLMLMFLESQDLRGFVDGTISKHDKPPALDMYSDLIDERWEEIKKEEEERQENWRRSSEPVEEEKLKETHYEEWNLRMKWKEKVEDRGKRKQKREEEELRYTGWKRSDGLVKGWILALATQEMLLQVIELETARDVWIKLEKILGPSLQLSHHDLIDMGEKGSGKISEYVKLHKAALHGDWAAANQFFERKPNAVFQPITCCSETALIVAVRSDKRNSFMENLITKMVQDSTHRENVEKERMRRMRGEMMNGMEEMELKEMGPLLRERMDTMERDMMLGFEGLEGQRMETRLLERMQRMELKLTEGMENMDREEMMRTLQERMEKLLQKRMEESVPLLAQKDKSGATALHAAAEAGNKAAAKLLLEKNRELANIEKEDGKLPVHVAAELGNGDMVNILLPKTKIFSTNESNPAEEKKRDELGHKLLLALASSGLYDNALKFLKEHPRLASMEPSPLEVMAQKRTSFLSGTNWNWLQRPIYSVIPSKVDNMANQPQPLPPPANQPQAGDLENPEGTENPPQVRKIGTPPANQPQAGDLENPEGTENPPQVRNIGTCAICVVSSLICVRKKLNAMIWDAAEKLESVVLIPFNCLRDDSHKKIRGPIKYVRETKKVHHQALELVKCLCIKAVETNFSCALKIFRQPLMNATRAGINEIVEEILVAFPSAIHLKSEKSQSLFHLAIEYRREKVFNLIHQMQEDRSGLLSTADASTNNALHLAGNLGQQQQLLLRASAAGAALQMQRELQWFKEVGNFILPHARESMNADGKTPQEVFTDTHKDLVKEGEKWMKSTATSCTITAALITTILFAAAITVPGGSNDNTGVPIQLGTKAFTLFGFFNALALLASSTSLLIFLSILTCRYGEDDFLYSLPTRMIFGLMTLFLSIIAMMVAFAATLIILFGEKKKGIIIVVALSCCVPVGVFVVSQFPLLYTMMKCTWGWGIFRKQSKRILH